MQLGDKMKINLKNKRGFTTVDLSIALIVVILFVSVMTSISYNVYLSSTEAKRTAVALNYGVELFEHIGAMDFEEVVPSYELVETENLGTMKDIVINANSVEGNKGTYKIRVSIQDYKNANKIKIISLKIEYPISRKKSESIELERIKVVEEKQVEIL